MNRGPYFGNGSYCADEKVHLDFTSVSNRTEPQIHSFMSATYINEWEPLPKNCRQTNTYKEYENQRGEMVPEPRGIIRCKSLWAIQYADRIEQAEYERFNAPTTVWEMITRPHVWPWS